MRHRVQSLAERGVFQGWRESAERQGRTTFRFRWLLGHEFVLGADPIKRELTAKDLLPGIENRSFIDADLRRFVATRSAAGLPTHRRLDPDRVALTYRNRGGKASLVMQVLSGDDEYPVTALLGQINELFSHLQLNHIDYLQRAFGVPEE